MLDVVQRASQIINNYVGQSNDTPPFANAEDAFRIYNADGNYDSRVPGQHYYDFRYGDVAFFVMDTRRHRSNPLTDETASRTMLGETQLSALYEWLGKVCLKYTRSPTSRPILIIPFLSGQSDCDVQIYRHVGSVLLTVDARRPGRLMGRLRLGKSLLALCAAHSPECVPPVG